MRVEQLSIQFVARQATSPAFTEDTQHRFGVLHFANLPVFGIRSPVLLRPAEQLSCPPWQVVTPATSTSTLSP
jgi:hypothetical protein